LFVQGNLSFRPKGPESAVIELSNNVPERNGVIDENEYKRFLGGSVSKSEENSFETSLWKQLAEEPNMML
jgi:hypothetical protein